MRKRKGMIALVMAVAMIGGCTGQKELAGSTTPPPSVQTAVAVEEESKGTDHAQTAGVAMISFTDSVGRTVEIPADIQRIAPSGGLAQQVLLTLAPEKLVVVSAAIKGDLSTKILQQAAALPEVGQFYGKGDFHAETLAKAKPQLIIDIGEPKKTIKEDMDSIAEKTGIPTIFVEMKMENAAEAYRTLGKILGLEARGEELGGYCEKRYKEIVQGMSSIVQDKRIKYVYLLGDNGLNAIAKGSFQGEMMELLGDNVVQVGNVTAKGSGNEISAEQLAIWNPQIILFAPKSFYSAAGADPFFSTLTAIREKSYYEVPNVPYNWVGMPPSVNRFLGMQWVAQLFYPEVFTYNLEDRVTEYFKLFYHYDLSREEYQKILQHSIKVGKKEK